MRRILLLLLGTLLQVSAATADGLQEDIGRFLSVDCFTNKMTVRLSFNQGTHRSFMTRNIADALSKSEMKIGNFPNCSSFIDTKNKEHSFTFTYSECGVQNSTGNLWEKFSADVVVNIEPTKMPSHMNTFLFPVSCIILNHTLSTFRVEMNVQGRSVDTSEESIVEAPARSRVRLEVKPTFYSKGLQEVFTYPAQCVISSADSPTEKTIILHKGCPTYSGRYLLSSVYQKEATEVSATSTEVFFVTNNLIFPGFPSNGRKVDITAQCSVFFCSSDARNRIFGVPLCPSATPCESPVREQPLLQVGGAGAVRLHSAHLPVTLSVDLERDGGAPREWNAVRQPEPSPLVQPCQPSSAITASILVSSIVITGLLASILGALVMNLCTKRSSSGSRSVVGSAVVSQADHPQQPYFKLDHPPNHDLLPEAPTLS